MNIKSMSIALLLTGILLLSTSAFAYETGPTKISNNLGNFVSFETQAQREQRYEDSCYFTSEGIVCPNLNVLTPARVLSQPRVSTVDTAVEDDFTEKNSETVQSMAKERPGRVMVVTSISGNPGSFHRWTSQKRARYAAQSCYFSADSGSQGNLVCPEDLNYQRGLMPYSFRTPEEKLGNLVATGKSQLQGANSTYSPRNSPGATQGKSY